jgi:hypothetical protein
LFTDFEKENCKFRVATRGDDIKEAIFMAEDILRLKLHDAEKNGLYIPAPSDINDIPLEKGEFVQFIHCDTADYERSCYMIE